MNKSFLIYLYEIFALDLLCVQGNQYSYLEKMNGYSQTLSIISAVDRRIQTFRWELLLNHGILIMVSLCDAIFETHVK